ncbi:AraC family transcriptional regulator [Streptococcus moroccensis]|uniref:YSIRK-targeted surface antigen transcriptional regulator n=1 Tax=Streptococcus moroccensis TaxID=1451356 RepID=A0ABT9YQ07_9STRE|nr:AraC family transcriptional regulator [Streptococcus moroccensis]MDQ0221809.1 YSIRK-targeted surface antigen transcriptional regulator [Streptococcus moroccensis]
MNLEKFCQSFYQATYIPITKMTLPAQVDYSFPRLADQLPIFSTYTENIHFNKRTDYYITKSFAFFGIIQIKNSLDYIVIGPIFSTSFLSNHVEAFMQEMSIPNNYKDILQTLLENTPTYSLNQCLHMLNFLNLNLNNELLDLTPIMTAQSKYKTNFNRRLAQQLTESKEESRIHNTYHFEQRLLKAVETGNTRRIVEILNEAGNLSAGKLAENTVRQQKNIFITAVTLVTRAAVAGGLDVEQAYSLSDIYIQECERLDDINKILDLNQTMYYDFTNRVIRQKLNSQTSKEVFVALQFIHNNTNQTIKVEDVAQISGYSYSYLKKKFKNEVGKTINEYIIQTKLEEAKELLKYSDFSISDISNYLSFSSQSYFQNLFKKYHGITPLQCRKGK